MNNEFMNTIDGDRYCSVTEISKIFRISRSPIYRLIKEGKIKAVKFGQAYRIKISTMRAFIEANGSWCEGLYNGINQR